MPVSASNLKFYLSGGAANTDPNASLGGARSTTAVPVSINNLFDDVTGAESTAGSTEYRCVYFRQEDADAEGLIAPIVWLVSNTPSLTTSISIGLDPAGKNGTAVTIANELAAPVGVTFTAPSTKSTGLALAGTPYVQNDYAAIWLKRVVDAGTSSATTDPATIRVEGDTI
jgi:hypothetical protein